MSDKPVKPSDKDWVDRGASIILPPLCTAALGTLITTASDTQFHEFEKALDWQASEHVQVLKDSGRQMTADQVQDEFLKKRNQLKGEHAEEAKKVYDEHSSRNGKGTGTGAAAGVLAVIAAEAANAYRRKQGEGQEVAQDNGAAAAGGSARKEKNPSKQHFHCTGGKKVEWANRRREERERTQQAKRATSRMT